MAICCKHGVGCHQKMLAALPITFSFFLKVKEGPHKYCPGWTPSPLLISRVKNRITMIVLHTHQWYQVAIFDTIFSFTLVIAKEFAHVFCIREQSF